MPPARRSRLPRTRRPRPRQALTDELAASQAGLNHSGRAQVAVARRCLGQFEEDPPTKPQTVTVIARALTGGSYPAGYTPIEMDVPSILRQARRGAGLSQSALAARAQTSQATVSAYESGRKQPSVETL